MALRAVVFDYGMVLTGNPDPLAHDKMVQKGYQPVGKTDGNYEPGKTGIDGVYKSPTPPPDYVITEVK